MYIILEDLFLILFVSSCFWWSDNLDGFGDYKPILVRFGVSRIWLFYQFRAYG